MNDIRSYQLKVKNPYSNADYDFFNLSIKTDKKDLWVNISTDDNIPFVDFFEDGFDIKFIYELFGISSDSFESNKLSIKHQFTGYYDQTISNMIVNENIIFNCYKKGNICIENKLSIFIFNHKFIDFMLLIAERQMFTNNKKVSISYPYLISPIYESIYYVYDIISDSLGSD